MINWWESLFYKTEFIYDSIFIKLNYVYVYIHIINICIEE